MTFFLFVSAGLLLCYDLPVQTDRDGRPITRFMVSRGRIFQQMLTTLIHEVEHLLLYKIKDTKQMSDNNEYCNIYDIRHNMKTFSSQEAFIVFLTIWSSM